MQARARAPSPARAGACRRVGFTEVLKAHAQTNHRMKIRIKFPCISVEAGLIQHSYKFEKCAVSTRQPDYDQVPQWEKSSSDDSAYFVQILCNFPHTSTVHVPVLMHEHLYVPVHSVHVRGTNLVPLCTIVQ